MSGDGISLLAVLNRATYVTAEMRTQAVEAVKQHFLALLEKHNIEDVDLDEVEELSQDLIDELCFQTLDQEYYS